MTDVTERLMPGVPGAARWLGLAGLLPFLCVGAAVWFGFFPDVSGPILLSYGIAILSFMGGCRWGLAAAGYGEGPALMPLAISVLPALYAVPAILLPPIAAFLGLAAGFVALFYADIVLARKNGAPRWWPALRWPLTTGAVFSLCVAAAA